MQSLLVCEECNEERVVQRRLNITAQEKHPCRSCSNKINGRNKRGRPSWNSGKRYSIAPVEKTSYVNSSGYVEIWCGRGPESRGRKDGYRLAHHLVAEDMLGRALLPQEIVHHIDGNKLNNIADNLYVCESISEHRQIHSQLESISMKLVQDGLIRFVEGRYHYGN